MQINPTSEADAASRVPFLVAADLQDDLMTATNDLDRLQTLLGDACGTLQASFFSVWQLLEQPVDLARAEASTLDAARKHLGTAVTALQFQDMASQLVEHLRRRLRHCADRLARDTFADDEDGVAAVEAAPLRPNPVTQAEMDTGFVELF
jgi:hypothetical protein